MKETRKYSTESEEIYKSSDTLSRWQEENLIQGCEKRQEKTWYKNGSTISNTLQRTFT